MPTCTVRLKMERDRVDDVVGILRRLKGPVRSQPGCTQALLMHDVGDDLVVTWVSRWRTRDDLNGHLRSPHFRRILAVLDLAARPPAVEFDCETHTRGLDLVAEVLRDVSDPHRLNPPFHDDELKTGGTP